MKDSQGDRGRGISRRGFLTGTGAAAAAAAGVNAELAPAATQPAGSPGFGPAAVQLQLAVNGQAMTTSVEPRVTLLDALRNYLDVTGCKRVCDRGTCGACTVTVNGRTVYSCTMLAIEARGTDIRTAEGLDRAQLDAVPAAFADNDAQQCGFCTPGFVVSMRAALDRNPNATPEEVEAALAGNICRCGTYEQMRHAIVQLCKKGG